MNGAIRIGVLADTHIPHLLKAVPDAVLEVFADVDLILHAGDLDEPCALDDLKRLAPVVTAVRGNIHLRFGTRSSPHLPKATHLWIKGHHIVLNHGIPYLGRAVLFRLLGVAGEKATVLNQRLIRMQQHAFPDADVVVFGHSHHAIVERRGKTLFVNPGAPAITYPENPPSVALMAIDDREIDARIVVLADDLVATGG